MVQLVLGWHPAGIKDNHLSAKVIISYKQNRIRYSFDMSGNYTVGPLLTNIPTYEFPGYDVSRWEVEKFATAATRRV